MGSGGNWGGGGVDIKGEAGLISPGGGRRRLAWWVVEVGFFRLGGFPHAGDAA